MSASVAVRMKTGGSATSLGAAQRGRERVEGGEGEGLVCWFQQDPGLVCWSQQDPVTSRSLHPQLPPTPLPSTWRRVSAPGGGVYETVRMGGGGGCSLLCWRSEAGGTAGCRPLFNRCRSGRGRCMASSQRGGGASSLHPARRRHPSTAWRVGSRVLLHGKGCRPAGFKARLPVRTGPTRDSVKGCLPFHVQHGYDALKILWPTVCFWRTVRVAWGVVRGEADAPLHAGCPSFFSSSLWW